MFWQQAVYLVIFLRVAETNEAHGIRSERNHNLNRNLLEILEEMMKKAAVYVEGPNNEALPRTLACNAKF